MQQITVSRPFGRELVLHKTSGIQRQGRLPLVHKRNACAVVASLQTDGEARCAKRQCIAQGFAAAFAALSLAAAPGNAFAGEQVGGTASQVYQAQLEQIIASRSQDGASVLPRLQSFPRGIVPSRSPTAVLEGILDISQGTAPLELKLPADVPPPLSPPPTVEEPVPVPPPRLEVAIQEAKILAASDAAPILVPNEATTLEASLPQAPSVPAPAEALVPGNQANRVVEVAAPAPSVPQAPVRPGPAFGALNAYALPVVGVPSNAAAAPSATLGMLPELATEEQVSVASTGLSLLNGLGVVVAGAALGLWALSRRERDEVETELTKRLKAQGSDLQQLKAQVNEAKGAISREQEAAEKLRQAMAAAQQEAQYQLELERKAKEAKEREQKLVQESLEAEQRRANALRKEAAATEEALQAEKAAKFAADAEARVLQQQLEELNTALSQERSLAASIGLEAVKTKESLISTKSQVAEFVGKNAQISNEMMTLKEAMTIMKAQAAEMAAAASSAAQLAASERATAESQLALTTTALTTERETVKSLMREMREAKAELAERKKEIESLKVELMSAQQQVGELTGQLIQMRMQAQDAEERLAKEAVKGKELQEEASRLKSELTDTQSQLVVGLQQLEGEKMNVEELRKQVSAIKLQYNESQDKLEAEQNNVMNASRELAKVQGLVSELQLKNQRMIIDWQADRDASEAALAESRGELDTMKKDAEDQMTDATNALNVLNKVIDDLKGDVAEAETVARSAMLELEAERLARQSAQSQVESLRLQLQSAQAKANTLKFATPPIVPTLADIPTPLESHLAGTSSSSSSPSPSATAKEALAGAAGPMAKPLEGAPVSPAKPEEGGGVSPAPSGGVRASEAAGKEAGKSPTGGPGELRAVPTEAAASGSAAKEAARNGLKSHPLDKAPGAQASEKGGPPTNGPAKKGFGSPKPPGPGTSPGKPTKTPVKAGTKQ